MKRNPACRKFTSSAVGDCATRAGGSRHQRMQSRLVTSSCHGATDAGRECIRAILLLRGWHRMTAAPSRGGHCHSIVTELKWTEWRRLLHGQNFWNACNRCKIIGDVTLNRSAWSVASADMDATLDPQNSDPIPFRTHTVRRKRFDRTSFQASLETYTAYGFTSSFELELFNGGSTYTRPKRKSQKPAWRQLSYKSPTYKLECDPKTGQILQEEIFCI